MKEGLQPGKKESKTELAENRRFENQVAYEDWVLKHTLSLYEKTHPVVAYTRSLFNTGLPPEAVAGFDIRVYRGEANAFCLPNGSIYVADGLPRLATSEEGIRGVLGHEKMHVIEEHGKKSHKRQAAPRSVQQMISQSLSHLGQARFHEWESDIRSFINAEEEGYNPMGYIELMEQLRQQAKGYDIIHGSMNSRILNLRTLTRIHDIATIQDPLHPIPQETKEQLFPKTTITSTYEAFLAAFSDRDLTKINKYAQEMNPQTALLVLPTVIGAYRKQKRFHGDSAKNWAGIQHQIIAHLGQMVWGHIDETFADGSFSDKQKTMLFHTSLALVANADTTNPKEQELFAHPQVTTISTENRVLPWNKRTTSFFEQIYTKEDVEQYLDVIKPEVFSTLGMKLTAEPNRLVTDLTKRILAREIYTDANEQFDPVAYADFVHKISTHLSQLYDVHGAVEHDTTNLAERLIKGVRTRAGEQYTELQQEVAKRMPEMRNILLRDADPVESLPQKQLVTFCEEYLKESKKIVEIEKRQRTLEKSSGLEHFDLTIENAKTEGMEEDILTKFSKDSQKKIENILQQVDYTSSHAILTFLADFRKEFKTSDYWKDYDINNERIYDALNTLLHTTIIRKAQEQITMTPQEAFVLKLKAALLLSSDVTTGSPLYNLAQEFTDELATLSDFSLDFYRSVYAVTTDGIDRELGRETDTLILKEDQLNDTWKNALREALYPLVTKNTHLPKASFHQFIETTTTEFPLEHYGSHHFFETRDTEDKAFYRKNSSLAAVFATYDFSLEDQLDLKTLYYLSTYFENTNYAVRLQDVVLRKLTEQLSFADGLAFFKQEAQSRRILSLGAFEAFIDAKAITHEQLAEAKQVAIGLLTRGGSEDFGKIIVAEEIANQFFDTRQKKAFFLAGLGNGQNDETMKTYLYRNWRSARNAKFDFLETINFDHVLSQVYSLDAQSKYMIIRDLLTGENGLLVEDKTDAREQLINFFLDNYVTATTEGDKSILETAREVMHEFAKKASFDLLYFAIAPFLQKRFLTPPQDKVDWETVVAKEDAPRGFDVKKPYTNVERGERPDNHPTKKAINQIVKEMTGSKQNAAIKRDEQARSSYETVVGNILQGHEQQERDLKLSAPGFIVEVAQTLGGPGVRFLQLLGQYIDVQSNLENQFSAVYDKLEGQSKIAADQTILRDWPEAATEVDGLHERHGGGSLMSTFATIHREAGMRIQKVLNPNAALQTEITHEVLSDVFTTLVEKKSEFAPALPLLEDIKEWLIGDINFTGFLEQDQRFREMHDGFSMEGQYRIKVPHSYGPERKTFAQDEYIQGHNLTEMSKLQAEGHDLKQIMSLLTTNFFRQLADGQMHANIHPGNIRVTPDNQVAYLDRNFYQHFSDEDRAFLFGILGSRNAINETIDLSLAYTGVSKTPDERQRIIEKAEHVKETDDPTRQLLDVVILLRKEGIRFPLRITLLLQNIFFLDRMSKRAGHKNLLDALNA